MVEVLDAVDVSALVNDDGVGFGVDDDGVGEDVGEGVGDGVGEGVGEGVGTALHWHFETLLQSVMRLLSKSLQIPNKQEKSK